MKHSMLIILVTGIIILALTGCDRRAVTVPTDPNQVNSDVAERVLAFQYYTTINNQQYYNIQLIDTWDTDKDISDDIVEITIGDSLIPMYYAQMFPYFTGWFAEDSHLLLSSNQNIKLKINNNIVLNTFVRAVNKASAAFPESYDYQQSQVLNWSVNSGNQYQFVKAEAWFNNTNGDISPYSSYVKQISTEDRSHTFPANCLTLSGELQNTTFVLAVQEVNYKIVSNNAVMVYQIEGYGYNDNKGTSDKLQSWHNALELNKLLSHQIDNWM